jgi:hypothetical protein
LSTPTTEKMHTCGHCGHVFHGKVCNVCGEKIFHKHHLGVRHFFHEVIDFFYHFESKVLKTIKLNFIKPGFVTKANLAGVRIPYANPVQLYLVVAIIFYLVVSKVGARDYIPASGDHNFYHLSDYTALKWAEPVDVWAVNGIDSLWIAKGREIESVVTYNYENTSLQMDGNLKLYARRNADSLLIPPDKQNIIYFRVAAELRESIFNAKIGTYAKSLIFIILPFFAAFFFLLSFKKIKYYGASLILSTHFMVYNLCCYTLYAFLNYGAANLWGNEYKGWVFRPFMYFFYNGAATPVSEFIFGGPFEFVHFIMWMPWLLIAFRRLFNIPWWKNLLASYLCCKIFYFLIFGVLKKILIAFTIWSMHL